MLHLGRHIELAPVLLFLQLIDIVLEPGPLAGHVLRLRCGFFDHVGLTLIASVAPHLGLLAMQQLRQHVAVCHASAGGHRVDVALLAVHADVRLQPEVPLVSFPGLVHLRVALAARVLGRRRRMDDGCIHDRAGRDLDAFGLQMHVHRIQHQPVQIVLLQQMTEPQDRCLIRRRRHAKIDAHEPPRTRTAPPPPLDPIG